MEQRTPEWFAARLGRATGSCFADILAKTKAGESASRRNYRAKLVCERLTGRAEEGFTNAAMAWGTEHEPLARTAYEAETGLMVQEVGFIQHPEMMAGVSPDGLVGDSGLVEIKCPNTATHIDTLLAGMPSGHIAQVQGQMWICGCEWCDFVSFDPRMPDELQLYVQRIYRDEEYIKTLADEVERFLSEVDMLCANLLNIKQRKAA